MSLSQFFVSRATGKVHKSQHLLLLSERMHTDLSYHLHTPECIKIIDELKTCHSEHSFAKFVGVCNSIDNRLVKCLKGERQARAAANREKARKQQALVRERMLNSEKKTVPN